MSFVLTDAHLMEKFLNHVQKSQGHFKATYAYPAFYLPEEFPCFYFGFQKNPAA